MVKSVLGVNHQGLTDWLLQRISAVVMIIYVVGIVLFLMTNPNLEYAVWHSLFAQLWMKVATMVLLLCLLFHTWIGIWTVLTDYIKPFVLSFVLQTIILLALVSFFFAGLWILWGV